MLYDLVKILSLLEKGNKHLTKLFFPGFKLYSFNLRVK